MSINANKFRPLARHMVTAAVAAVIAYAATKTAVVGLVGPAIQERADTAACRAIHKGVDPIDVAVLDPFCADRLGGQHGG